MVEILEKSSTKGLGRKEYSPGSLIDDKNYSAFAF